MTTYSSSSRPMPRGSPWKSASWTRPRSPGQQILRNTHPENGQRRRRATVPRLESPPQSQQPSPQNLSKPVGNLASSSNYFPVSEIRLPTVPIPTTSMFSSITPVISQAAAAPSNYLFTNLPQHSAQPNFDVSMLQSKTIGAGNRTPVSNSNDLFSNLLNMPKWSSVGRIQRAMLNEYSKWYVYYVLVQEQCNTDTVPPT